ncbi:MAG: 1,4-dihydroxy-6-naphthoate synthase, partial [Myxococcota bacterium]
MFHALVSGAVPCRARFAPWLADIEELNRRALGHDSRPPLAVSKVSAAALGHLTRDYAVLNAGAALGRGNGPLVLRRGGDAGKPDLAALSGCTVAIPGERTTANLLLSIFGPPDLRRVTMRFDAIMPAVARGEVDAGLVIHESRFTFAEHGLAAVADLGEVWEADTGLPLPLGVIVAQRALGELAEAVDEGLARSVAHAFAHPDTSAAYVRQHAQEMAPEVCRRHIELYVGPFSADLGSEGRAAVQTLLARGAATGLLPADSPSPWR